MCSTKTLIQQRVENLANLCGVSPRTVYRRMSRIPLERLEANPSAMQRKIRSDTGKPHGGKSTGIYMFKPWTVSMSLRGLREAIADTFGANAEYITYEYIKAERDNLPFSKQGQYIVERYGLAGLFILPLCLEAYGSIPQEVPPAFVKFVV